MGTPLRWLLATGACGGLIWLTADAIRHHKAEWRSAGRYGPFLRSFFRFADTSNIAAAAIAAAFVVADAAHLVTLDKPDHVFALALLGIAFALVAFLDARAGRWFGPVQAVLLLNLAYHAASAALP